MDKNDKVEELASIVAVQRLAVEMNIDLARDTLVGGDPEPDFRKDVNRIYREKYGPIQDAVPSLLPRALLHCHQLPLRTWDVLWYDGDEEKFQARTPGELAIRIRDRHQESGKSIEVGIRPNTQPGFEGGSGYLEYLSGSRISGFSYMPAETEEVPA